MIKNNKNKYWILLLSIVFDGLGWISFLYPPMDIGWAPLSALLMTRLYKGKAGKIAALVSFIEEAMPILDVIPTFTIMWLYTYVFITETEERNIVI